MTWLVAGGLLLAAGLLVVQAFVSANPKTLARLIRYSGAALLVLLALPIAWRGGIALATFLIGIALMVAMGRPLRSLFAGGRGLFGRGASPTPGQKSEIDTPLLHVTLDHDSGEMDGRVRQGPFAGRRLSDMPIEALAAFLRECRTQDPDSAALVETYLTRHRAAEFTAAEDAPQEEPSAAPTTGAMTTKEALAVLGLAAGATRDEIIAAHRDLMKKLHPDHGGSDYLASKINQAKECLLEN